jgi:mannose-6-phosphate isomerase-like protein (cupin superfamily)
MVKDDAKSRMRERKTVADRQPIAFARAFARNAPLEPGQRSATLFRHGTMRLLYYAPRGNDPQTPHKQDEVYVVASGNGTFVCDGRRAPFVTGDVLFAPAHAEHRFENFSDDFGVWVIFYGPEGGET